MRDLLCLKGIKVQSSKVAPPEVPLEDQVALENAAFAADVSFDISSRSRFIAGIREPQMYSVEEEAIVAEGLALLAIKEGGAVKMSTVKVDSPLLMDAAAIVNADDHSVTGCARCEMWGATIDDYIAFSYDIESTWFVKYGRNPTFKDDKTLSFDNPHNMVVYYRVISPQPLLGSDRDNENRMVWKRLSPTQCILVLSPTTTTAPPPGVVRSRNTRVMRLTQIGPDVVSVELAFSINLGGFVPSAITQAFAVPASINGLSRTQFYFLSLKPLEKFDAGGEDAQHLAQLLCDSVHSAEKKGDDGKHRALLTFFARSVALRQLSLQYPWLPALIWHIVENKVCPPSTCTSPLHVLTSAEVRAIGTSFATVLTSNPKINSVVEEWIDSYPAMRELDKAVPMLKFFICQIAKCLRETVSLEDQVALESATFPANAELDRAVREKLQVSLRNPGSYSASEDAAVDAGLLVVARLGGDDKQKPGITLTKLETHSPLQTAYICHDKKRNVTFGKISTTVRGASLLDVVSDILNFESIFLKQHNIDEHEIQHCVLEHVNEHHQVWYYHGRFPPPFQGRDFCWSVITKRLNKNQYMCVLQPTLHAKAPITPGVVGPSPLGFTASVTSRTTRRGSSSSLPST